MMRPYEFTMIVRPDLDEVDTSAVLSRYEGKISAEGRVVKRDVWGTKRFAYPVKKFFRGYYVCYNIMASPKIVSDLERQIRFDNRVLRHIIIGITECEETPIKEETPAEQPTVDNDSKGDDEAVVKENTDEVSPQAEQVTAPEEESEPATDVAEVETTEVAVSDNEVASEPASTSDDQVSEPATAETTDDQVSEPATTETTDDQVSEPATAETTDDQVNEPATAETTDDQVSEPATDETSDNERPSET